MNTTNFSLAALSALLYTVGIGSAADATQYLGNPQPLGEGFVRSFVTLDDQGNPSEVGAILTPGSLSLPTSETTPDIVIPLSLPSEASTTAFDSLLLKYRTHGVPGVPEALGVPRLTLDALSVTPQEIASICPNPDTSGSAAVCVGDELAQALKPPKPEFIPQGMQPSGFVEPGFGERYFDPEAALPIFTGQQPFNTLYDYAFFDGQISSISFGGTKAFLETQSNLTKPIKIPTSYSKTKYYPTQYSVSFDQTSQEYKLSLSGLTSRSAPESSRSVPEPAFVWGLLGLTTWGAVFLQKNKLKQQKLVQQ